MKKIIKFLLGLLLFILLSLVFIKKLTKEDYKYMIDLSVLSIDEIKEYCKENNIELNITEDYSNTVLKNNLISQSIKPMEIIKNDSKLDVVLSLGIDYEKYKVNELGNIPVMMYHRIINMNNNDTKYTGGNVDYDGFSRTTESFINDLEFYYNSGYRMIRLEDYVNGIIDVELGYSPIVITFDDGLNQVKTLGLDSNGNIIIDPNCALGILESFKKKYPDYNVTATFFLNSELFNDEYNEKIINYLIDNGYDIGNHTYNHKIMKNMSSEETQMEVGKMYQTLDKITDKYVHIVALPNGYPYITFDNFKDVLEGTYNGYIYTTISTLRVGWEANYSPYSISFDSTYIKRIRAYDHNGTECDIEMNFKILENNRFISDGNKNTVTIKEKDLSKIKTNLEVITY